MKYIPSLSDIILILFIFILTGFGILFINLVFFKLTGFGAFLNTGYSMCKYEDPLLEILPVDHKECAWVPINILILNPFIDRNNLQIGDNVCYLKNSDIICHRILDKRERDGKVEYYIAGLHPRALKEWVPAEKVYAEVVDKFPRAMGGPFLMALFLGYNPVEIFIYLNKGFYI